jgi:hypothetical protein
MRGTWRVAGAALAVLCSNCGGGEAPSFGPNTVRTSDPVAAFAPLLALNEKERLLPISADSFLMHSVLRWRNVDCGGDVTIASHRPNGDVQLLEPTRLGGVDPYEHRPRRAPACRKAGVFATDDYTRPYDRSRANVLQVDEGFYLDLADSKRLGLPARRDGQGGQEVRAPVYVVEDRRQRGQDEMVRLTYWFLFAHERRHGPSYAGLTAHEGDWRWVRVLLRTRPDSASYVPIGVRFGVRSRYLDWRSVKVAPDGSGRTHPIIFVSRGSHGLFPDAKRYMRTVEVGNRSLDLREPVSTCPKCIAWRTWKDLEAARRKPWYGYGGAWGETLGLGTAPAGLGPSRWGDLTKDALLEPGNTG